MDRIEITGGERLAGTIQIGGAKNAALKMMVAALLGDERLVLHNVPRLADVATMRKLIEQLGLTVEALAPHTLSIGGAITSVVAPYDIVSQMRASILVLGPLLARQGEAKVSLPGGCAIGTRPVDFHLKGLEQMGAVIELEAGYIAATAPRGLQGAEILLPFPSVGATEHLMMTATLARGTTVIANAAMEPEIADQALCLNAMGARISGAGTSRIVIEGVGRLGGATHTVLPDRIEAGTYACAAAITGGDILLGGAKAVHLKALLQVLSEAGAECSEEAGGVRVRARGKLQGVDVKTEPYPGFATDMQAQLMAVMCVADGASMLTENVFENRFMHVPELSRMGARIVVHGASAIVRGVRELSGAPVMATDLRASSSLILAALAAKGKSVVSRVYHLDRGYEAVERKLSACGARIARVKE